MTRTDAIPAAGIPAAELEERRERLLEQVRARGASGYVLFDQSVHPVPHGLLVSLERASDRVCADRVRRVGDLRPRVRGCAHPRGGRLRPDRVVCRVPRSRASDGHPRPGTRRPRDVGPGRSRPGWLPGDPRLPGPRAEHDHRVGRLADLGRDRSDDGAQERRRGRAHPRERALVRTCAPTAAGVHTARCDRGGVEPARRTGGDARDARGAGRSLRRAARIERRRVSGLSRPDRPPQRLGPCDRAQHPVRAGRHARDRDWRRRCGATTPSSSAR